MINYELFNKVVGITLLLLFVTLVSLFIAYMIIFRRYHRDIYIVNTHGGKAMNSTHEANLHSDSKNRKLYGGFIIKLMNDGSISEAEIKVEDGSSNTISTKKHTFSDNASNTTGIYDIVVIKFEAPTRDHALKLTGPVKALIFEADIYYY